MIPLRNVFTNVTINLLFYHFKILFVDFIPMKGIQCGALSFTVYWCSSLIIAGLRLISSFCHGQLMNTAGFLT